MLQSEDGKLSVKGSVTIHNVVALVERGIALFNRDDLIIDLAQVTEVDSSAVSMLLEWQREARRRNCRIRFANAPQNLKGLAQLYGVSGLISLA
ncbi:phospholipid transport system transporter-binding protein [Nitrosospira sp. Nl5]|uniref:STAS domain-containing protein n=1 Tax=Nitrosospira sp. Nl5 TaxID=200120 RepID=UPI0008864C80|nr:STAS domain-containing protein [Nitrosospira sp. Nl5]SCY67654.1 phospholipid transport system transporter-binding protein [Nitrosospira sp. Nl5]